MCSPVPLALQSQYLLKRVVQKAAGNGPWYAANQGVLVGTRAIRETAAYLGRSPFQSLSSPLTQGPLRDPRDVSQPPAYRRRTEKYLCCRCTRAIGVSLL